MVSTLIPSSSTFPILFSLLLLILFQFLLTPHPPHPPAPPPPHQSTILSSYSEIKNIFSVLLLLIPSSSLSSYSSLSSNFSYIPLGLIIPIPKRFRGREKESKSNNKWVVKINK
uniref:Uncharacterized protein n=1 Tax=Cacopsylla melanoneura TaxID=428564 RepID=A0A8D8RG65_9HEMI